MTVSGYISLIRKKIGNDLLTSTSVNIVIFDNVGSILLVQKADTGQWELPGGAIEPEELPSDAAIRECYEETGLEIKLKRVVGVFGGKEFLIVYPNGDNTYYTTITFEAEIIKGVPAADGQEIMNLAYFTHNQCQDLEIIGACKSIIKCAFSRTDATYFSEPTSHSLENKT